MRYCFWKFFFSQNYYADLAEIELRDVFFVFPIRAPVDTNGRRSAPCRTATDDQARPNYIEN